MLLFNRDRVAGLVSEIRKALGRLESLRVLNKEEFLRDTHKVSSAKYNLIVAIECAIDICTNVISQNGFRAPENYADTFKVLEEQGAFDSELGSRLRSMAKFRNRLVHLYWEVDDSQVYEILQTKLDDFKMLINSVANFLNLGSI